MADRGEIRAGEGVFRVSLCALSVVPGSWRFANENRAAIDAHWDACRAANPAYFNGAIYVLSGFRLAEGRFQGELLRTDFKSFLYWRDLGWPLAAGVRDCFGAALIRSGDGAVLLGRQAKGHLNAGQAYLPGGFIDDRDVGADGSIDMTASALREVEEETGLAVCDLEVLPGLIVTVAGPSVALVVEMSSALAATDLRAEMLARIARQPDPELADVVILRHAPAIDDPGLAPYARVLLRAILPVD